MEGPVPVCSKVFETEKICDIPITSKPVSKPVEFTFHNKLIKED